MTRHGDHARGVAPRTTLWISACILCTAALPARADWNPSTGQWGKSDSHDVRVMTYNIQDAICTGGIKAEGAYSWCAVAHIVAAMKPDVLIIQEAGDNQGDHGSGGVDSVADLETTLNLFLHGGADPFLGGTVGAYVQKYAPAYDLPYVWASATTDGYNRNAILSRFPYADLNGDGLSQRSDLPYVLIDQYVEAAGAGGIRGVMVGELDLPDDVYLGDLVIENAHLKSGSAAADHTERIQAAERIAYHNDYLLNGAGTGIPDPHSKIIDAPPVTNILDPYTPVILGGDWNEDESTNGLKGPAEWIASAATLGGTDGTDRDRTDATYDDARNPYTNARFTEGSQKYDYLCWQDSIASIRRAIIFNSIGLPSGWYPPEIASYVSPPVISAQAADHRPVFVDFILPLVPSPDVTPPSPDPMTFATPPYAASASSIAMTATTATDAESPPVQYFFNFVSGGSGGSDSGWQSSTSYTDSDLAPNATYTYRVKARDSAATPNETAYSSPAASATTLANVPAAPTVGNPTAATMDLDVNPNGNPASTEFALLCAATSDANWVGKYVDATGNSAASAVWRTEAQWGTITVQGLAAVTQYCFQATARNSELVETALSAQSCAQTTAIITPGDLNCDGSVNFQDINPFVLALSNPSAYATTYPNCNILAGDINGDGTTGFRDINPFVALLSAPP